MSALESLPQEILIDDILPLLSLHDVLSTFQVSKFFAKLGQDEVFWRRRLRQDFNYTSASNARANGFKFLYRRLNNPMVYVWGESGEGRLGRPLPKRRGRSMGSRQYWPIQVDVPGCRIVELASGGWSFSALDSEGHVHVWGQLDSGYGFVRDGFAHNTKQASRPLRLGLATPIHAISCGRNFTTALDHRGKVWCFNSWGRPFVFQPASFDPSNPDNDIVQVECGWTFSAALNASGTAFVWNPLEGAVGRAVSQRDAEFDNGGDEGTRGMEVDGVIKCHTWTLEGTEPLKLPELPQLPTLIEGEATHPQLVKIAAGDQFIIGLTNGGHVVKLDLTDINHPDAIKELGVLFQQRIRVWEYMPLFSETSKVKEMEEFNMEGGPAPPSQLKISHVESLAIIFNLTTDLPQISAHFLTFTAYSTGNDSIVLMGLNDASPTAKPRVIPALQNRGVIAIVLGDYQFGALLENGQLLTWGQAGAAGLGEPTSIEPGSPGGFRTEQERIRSLISFQNIPDVQEPTEVRFDHELVKPRKRFVFAAAAAGWHMGALIVDLEEGEPEVKDPIPEEQDNKLPDNDLPTTGPSSAGIFSPFLFRGAMFPTRGINQMRGIRPPRPPSEDE